MISAIPLLKLKLGRCSGEGDALLTATIPIFLKAGLLEGFSRDMFDMVVIGCFYRTTPHLLEQADEYLDRIIETYRPSSEEGVYFYSEIFCKWWGDLFIGLGPVITADMYSQYNETFAYEMIHRSEHRHKWDTSVNQNICHRDKGFVIP